MCRECDERLRGGCVTARHPRNFLSEPAVGHSEYDQIFPCTGIHKHHQKKDGLNFSCMGEK